jgi:hypothetical protein
MNDVWIALLSVAIGGVIGAVAPMFSAVLRTRSERRMEYTRLIVQAAIAEHKTVHDFLLKESECERIAPLSLYMHHFSGILDMIDRGQLNAENLQRFHAKHKEIDKFFRSIGT